MSERTYVIGLPVVVTVADEGTVTYEVCTEDASGEIVSAFYEGWVEDKGLTLERVLEDARLVSAFNERRRED